MANQGSLTLTAQFSNPLGPNQTINPGTQNYTNVVGSTLAIALSSGFNTITIPTGTTTVVVQLPTGNATAVTLKGVTGDTGIPLAVTSFAKFDPVSGTASFGITAGSAISAFTYITFL